MKKLWVIVVMAVMGVTLAEANLVSMSGTAPGTYLWGNNTGTSAATVDGIAVTSTNRYTWGQSFSLASAAQLGSVTFKMYNKTWDGITARVVILDNPVNWTAAGQDSLAGTGGTAFWQNWTDLTALTAGDYVTVSGKNTAGASQVNVLAAESFSMAGNGGSTDPDYITFDFDTSISLSAGTAYFALLYFNGTTTASIYSSNNSENPAANGSVCRRNNSNNQVSANQDLVFFANPIPEPATIGLLGFSAVVVLMLRRITRS